MSYILSGEKRRRFLDFEAAVAGENLVSSRNGKIIFGNLISWIYGVLSEICNYIC